MSITTEILNHAGNSHSATEVLNHVVDTYLESEFVFEALICLTAFAIHVNYYVALLS
ncbi:MAG: hypothetical protein OEY89_12240 [Gammaproteobacteria bacterium]|nr:hypothetical protein [Gammaproteobacteria bacterium]